MESEFKSTIERMRAENQAIEMARSKMQSAMERKQAEVSRLNAKLAERHAVQVRIYVLLSCSHERVFE